MDERGYAYYHSETAEFTWRVQSDDTKESK